MKLSRLSDEHFRSAAQRSRMSPESIEVARRVLVLGERQTDVAKQLNYSRSWVSEAVKKMLRYAAQPDDIPAGWKSDVAVLPPALWREVRQMERRARGELAGHKKRSPVTRKRPVKR